MKLLTRRMDEMTSREIELYLKGGGDLAFVPFGPISGHGALIPVGMHGHWAQALSLLLAERANGLVFPVTWCCFAGARRTTDTCFQQGGHGPAGAASVGGSASTTIRKMGTPPSQSDPSSPAAPCMFGRMKR
jgi:hypothetical protein